MDEEGQKMVTLSQQSSQKRPEDQASRAAQSLDTRTGTGSCRRFRNRIVTSPEGTWWHFKARH